MLNKPRQPNFANHTSLKGDTIIEVLIAIAVAGFAIGTSYAIADKSLDKAISSRERNESVNVIQSQLAALKLRYTYNKNDFNGDDPAKSFVVRSTTPNPPPSLLPKTDFHFCLDDQSASPLDSTHSWSRIENSSLTSDSDADNITDTNHYAPGCVHNVSGTDYFVDISAQITKSSVDNIPSYARTVYKLTVRWAQVGDTSNGQTVIYYRL
jgi:type II secretory pathway pseudopilin PulG